MHKIVVIDSSSFTRTRIVNLLHSGGYTNTEDYAAADDIGRRPQRYLNDADLIIADTNLPGVSGLDLALKLKMDSRYADIPIFFVSASGDTKTISAAIRAGAADYLMKPFDDDLLLDKVKKLLSEQPEIPDAFRCCEEKFIDMLSLEYQRATRGGQYLSILRLDLKKADMIKNLTPLRNAVRRIDTLVVFKGMAIMLLPLTDENGTAVVTEKLSSLLSGNGATLLGSHAHTYRGDGELNHDNYIQTILALAQ